MSSQTGLMTWRRLVQWTFYGGLGLLLALIVTGVLDQLVSPELATRVAYNSEAYLFAIVLASWVQFGLPRVAIELRVWRSIAYGAVWALVGIGLLLSGLPSRVVTLNEAAFALAVLIPYVSLRRPLPRWVLSAVPVLIGLTVWAIVWGPQSWVIDQAEAFGFVVLAMLTLDVFDRPLLDPDAQVNRWLRWAWYGFLVMEPVVVSGLGTDVRAGNGPGALTLDYLGRIHESFIGLLLVSAILHLVSDYRSKLQPQLHVEHPAHAPSR